MGCASAQTPRVFCFDEKLYAAFVAACIYFVFKVVDIYNIQNRISKYIIQACMVLAAACFHCVFDVPLAGFAYPYTLKIDKYKDKREKTL